MELPPLWPTDSCMSPLDAFSYIGGLMFDELAALQSRFFAPTWVPGKPVATKQGHVQGRRYAFKRGGVDAYLGIPYGKAPIGALRFQKPVPAESWTTVRQCVEFGPRCPQSEMFFEKYGASMPEKSEDCLRLNVFAPDWSPKQAGQPNGFAVMVFIHGGGFAVHSAAHYGDYGICEALCTKDVIIVTIQYRLGIFGFAVGDGIPENVGLWDQTLALHWVKDNIKVFGGDPDNVTIFGQSAGGACVDLLSLSPHSRDLFQKVIPMSGTSFCSFAVNSREHVKKACYDYAVALGYNDQTSKKPAPVDPFFRTPIEFLRSLPWEQLEVGLVSQHINKNGKLDLTPVVDGDFFPKPLDVLRREMPSKAILTGVIDYEGLLFVGLKPGHLKLREEVEKLIQRELVFHRVVNVDLLKKRLLDMYFDGVDKDNTKEMALACVKIVSDAYINIGCWRYAHEMTHLGHTVYRYSFEYFNPKSLGLLGLLLPFQKATHASEIPFIFKKGITANFHPTIDDLKVVDIMTGFFTNFAKNGDPNSVSSNPQIWKPLSTDDTSRYLSIDLEKMRMCEGLHDRRVEFWLQLLKLESEFRDDKAVAVKPAE
uniref:Carboxylic ester hydrolase n=1 Tax=Panagrellus redivivus TaxID=6233 RepID=A0A7E4UNN1_PANRE